MVEIKYKILGTGEQNIIVMHEWMGDSRNYENIYAYINTNDFKWFFIDFRGYGQSKNLEGNYNLEESVNDIKNLIKKYDMKEFNLVGHSMSSLIAQKLAIELNDNLNTLILITPILPTGIKMQDSAKEKLLNDVKNENNVIEKVVESASKRYNNIWKEQRIKLAHECSTIEAKLGYMNMYLTNDFSSNILKESTKVRVLSGKNDLPAFHKNTIEKRFRNYYDNFEIIECEQAGHYPMIECPVFFANQIEKFIKH